MEAMLGDERALWRGLVVFDVWNTFPFGDVVGFCRYL